MSLASLAIAGLLAAAGEPASPQLYRPDPSPMFHVGRVVRLDERSLAAIGRENPDRHARLVGILRVASEMSCDQSRVPRELKVRHEVDHAACSGLLKTSFPAKRELQFRLEDTRYVAVITMRSEDFRAMPVR